MWFHKIRGILKGFSHVTLSRSEGSIALGHENASLRLRVTNCDPYGHPHVNFETA